MSTSPPFIRPTQDQARLTLNALVTRSVGQRRLQLGGHEVSSDANTITVAITVRLTRVDGQLDRDASAPFITARTAASSGTQQTSNQAGNDTAAEEGRLLVEERKNEEDDDDDDKGGGVSLNELGQTASQPAEFEYL